MRNREIVKEIKACIKKAHEFTADLGKSTSINRNYLIKELNHISPSELHSALLDLKDFGEIEYSLDHEVITLTTSYKP